MNEEISVIDCVDFIEAALDTKARFQVDEAESPMHRINPIHGAALGN